MQVAMGGAGMNLGGSASSMGGSAPGGMGGSEPGGMGGSGNMPGGCPDDVSSLFRRPSNQGGCEGASCHSSGGIPPDLISPNVEERLLNISSTCQGRPYIGPGDSFLEDKLSGMPGCGFPMPFGNPDALSAADEQCILDWIEEVASGGG